MVETGRTFYPPGEKVRVLVCMYVYKLIWVYTQNDYCSVILRDKDFYMKYKID